MKKKPKYVIVNETDSPSPNYVCQWVPGVGYCYLNRKLSEYDGMNGRNATSINEFGFAFVEDRDGWCRFYRRDNFTPTATYSDGEPRRWQREDDFFEWIVLIKQNIKADRKKKQHPIAPRNPEGDK